MPAALHVYTHNCRLDADSCNFNPHADLCRVVRDTFDPTTEDSDSGWVTGAGMGSFQVQCAVPILARWLARCKTDWRWQCAQAALHLSAVVANLEQRSPSGIPDAVPDQ